jgi:non-haem Fe2+, alpha-ketoglutarate-dependent halogenase
MSRWDQIFNSIIPEPKARPFWERSLYCLGTVFLYGWKLLRLPVGYLPRPLQGIVKNWTPEMFHVVIGSWVTRAYIDQPCRFEGLPNNVLPPSKVPARHALSPEQIEAFVRDGFLGPLTACSKEEAAALAASLAKKRTLPSENFGFVTDRDLHLETPEMLELMRSPAILDAAAQLLGPDLMTWRSQLFFKLSGGREIQWHQASTYIVEDYLEPALVPPNRHRLFQLTVWIALTPSTLDNGCLEFIPGTHQEIRTIHFGGEQGFYKVSFELEYKVDPAKVIKMPMEPGQFVIFSERVIHGSGPNQTDNPRLAMNFRVIPPYVRVYPESNFHRAMHMGQAYSLEKWGTVMLRGSDEYGLNRRAQTPVIQ